MHYQERSAILYVYVDTSLHRGRFWARLTASLAWGCRLLDLAGRCSAMWYEDALLVSSSSLMREPLGSSWRLHHSPYLQCSIHAVCPLPKYGKTPWLDYRCKDRLLGYLPHLLVAKKSCAIWFQEVFSSTTDQAHQSCMHPPWWLPNIQIRIERLIGYKCYTTSALFG